MLPPTTSGGDPMKSKIIAQHTFTQPTQLIVVQQNQPGQITPMQIRQYVDQAVERAIRPIASTSKLMQSQGKRGLFASVTTQQNPTPKLAKLKQPYSLEETVGRRKGAKGVQKR